jgi:flagellar biosynthesis/type III secretory pathway protein FliH
MAVKTKPVRIFDGDRGPLRLLAELEKRSPAAVVHAALAEYFLTHRDELAATFTQAQEMIAAGNLEGLAQALAAGSDMQFKAMLADIEAG